MTCATAFSSRGLYLENKAAHTTNLPIVVNIKIKGSDATKQRLGKISCLTAALFLTVTTYGAVIHSIEFYSPGHYRRLIHQNHYQSHHCKSPPDMLFC